MRASPCDLSGSRLRHDRVAPAPSHVREHAAEHRIRAERQRLPGASVASTVACGGHHWCRCECEAGWAVRSTASRRRAPRGGSVVGGERAQDLLALHRPRKGLAARVVVLCTRRTGGRRRTTGAAPPSPTPEAPRPARATRPLRAQTRRDRPTPRPTRRRCGHGGGGCSRRLPGRRRKSRLLRRRRLAADDATVVAVAAAVARAARALTAVAGVDAASGSFARRRCFNIGLRSSRSARNGASASSIIAPCWAARFAPMPHTRSSAPIFAGTSRTSSHSVRLWQMTHGSL